MKKTLSWIGFIVILALIIWGLIVAMNRPSPNRLGSPAPVSANENVRGSSTAPVTLIEYSDFQCTACATYYPILERLLHEASTTVRFVYRHFPLNDVLPDGSVQHKNAFTAAQAAEAAGKQGKFWEMSAFLFVNQNTWAELNDPYTTFAGYAERLGLDLTRFKTDYNSQEVKDLITAQKNEGVRLGINATPTFFVNGQAINNPTSYEQFKAIIDSAASTRTP